MTLNSLEVRPGNIQLPAIAGGMPAFAAEERLIFQAPMITEAEIEGVANCLRSRWIGLGPRVTAFEDAFAAYTGAPYASAVSSCSAALHLALLSLGVGPGDEVVAPTMTYCATAHAILHVGATPVLADCEYASSNVSASTIAAKVTGRTKAVIVVHMAGYACDMADIQELCSRKNLLLIEDCAHAIETVQAGTHAGLFGHVGCFSFYPTKNITCGDGGMVITADKRLHRRIKLLSQNGMSADAWCRETTKRKTQILAPGYKYNMTDMEAALGMSQLSDIDNRWLVRERLSHLYGNWLQHRGIEMITPVISTAMDRPAYHLLSIRLRVEALTLNRDRMVDAMSAEHVGTGIHYMPLHQQPYYRRRYKLRRQDFPNASRIGERTLSLPLSADLTEETVRRVCGALCRLIDYCYKEGLE